MRRSLLIGLLVTDGLFLLYWALSGAAELGAFELPSAMMYAGYGEDRVCAWNWSFLPVDLAFSITGLMAVRWARRDDPRWQPTAIISLTLTVVAGLMAVSYWTLMAEIDLSWYLPNLLLVVWPLPFLVELTGMAKAPAPGSATAEAAQA